MRTPDEVEAWFEGELLPALRARAAEAPTAPPARRPAAGGLGRKLAIVAAGVAVDVLAGGVGATFVALAVAFRRELRGGLTAARRPSAPRVDVKCDVIAPVVRHLDPGLEYVPHGVIPEEVLRTSGIWEAPYDLYAGEDLIRGKLGATALQVCELRLAKRYRREVKRLFRGIFFVADFPKRFTSRTLVLPDESEGRVGLLARMLQGLPGMGRGELVELENPAFERHFKVYGDDPVEARLLLTTELMARLVRLREMLNVPLRVAFADGRVHLLIPHAGDLLRPDAARLDAAQLRTWLGEILLLTSFVEELDLETRLWGPPQDEAAGTPRADTPSDPGSGPGSSEAAPAGVPPEPEPVPATPTPEPGPRPLAGPLFTLTRRRRTPGPADPASEGRGGPRPRRLPYAPGAILRVAVEGRLPLLHTWLVFVLGGSLLLGQGVGWLAGAGLLPGPVASAVLTAYLVASQLLLWRNAGNTSLQIWTLLVRISVPLTLVGVVYTAVSRLLPGSA